MDTTDAKPEKRSWHTSPWTVSILLSFIAALFYSDRTAFTTLFPLLKDNLGFSDMGLAAINTFYLWSFALASPLAGFLGGRFPPCDPAGVKFDTFPRSFDLAKWR